MGGPVRRRRDLPVGKPLTGPRPRAEALRAIRVPTLVALAAESRAHNSRKVARAAEGLIPGLRTTLVPDATHYALGVDPPARLLADLADFLAPRPTTPG